MEVCERVVYGTEKWRDEGCSAKMVFEYARRHEIGCACYHGERIIEKIGGERRFVSQSMKTAHISGKGLGP